MSDEKSKKQNNDPDELVVQNIMRDERNREYLYKHLQDCGVFENIFHADTNLHSYNAGKRQAGLQLENDMKTYAPDLYIKMIKENIN